MFVVVMCDVSIVEAKANHFDAKTTNDLTVTSLKYHV